MTSNNILTRSASEAMRWRYVDASLALRVSMVFLAAIAASRTFAQAPSEFSDAIETAQARTVKIYGAGIGREPGYASGIIISDEGHILTAYGIFLAGERIRVVLADGTIHRAIVERRSEPLQSAILKIDAKTKDYWELPEKVDLRKGDWVLAVSNAFKVADGTEWLSVNLGIASLRTRLEARRGTQDVPYDGDVILIDAITSNPGAAGGAVVTPDGRLVGMIGKIIESKSTNTRLNYAVPADLLFRFVAGKPLNVPNGVPLAGKPSLGIRIFSLAGKRGPAYIDRITAGSAAAKAGLRSDDLILAIGENVVRDVQDYEKIWPSLTPGVEVEFLVKRRRELVRVPVTPDVAPE